MIQNSVPVDYVIATGECHSVAEFLEAAARAAVLDLDAHLQLVQSVDEYRRLMRSKVFVGDRRRLVQN